MNRSDGVARKPVAVIGGAGLSGGYVLRALKSRGARVTVVAHSALGAGQASAGGADAARVADMGDVGALADAIAGADGVHFIPPPFHPQETLYAVNALRAAERAGASCFVYSSVLHPHSPSMAHHMRKAAAEAVVRESALRWTILQPALYAQMLLASYGMGPPGDVGLPFEPARLFSVIDLLDLAEVAAMALLEEGHEYASYELVGDRRPMAEMIHAAGAARGVGLNATRLGPQSAPLPDALKGDPGREADVRRMWEEYDRHGLRGNSRVLAGLLGRAPATFADVARGLRGYP